MFRRLPHKPASTSAISPCCLTNIINMCIVLHNTMQRETCVSIVITNKIKVPVGREVACCAQCYNITFIHSRCCSSLPPAPFVPHLALVTTRLDICMACLDSTDVSAWQYASSPRRKRCSKIAAAPRVPRDPVDTLLEESCACSGMLVPLTSIF